MGPALSSSVSVVAYLLLFGGFGFAFIFVNLLIGRLLRPHDPHEEKREIYECGEPTIGSSFVQFDLRFYVVALVFIIFDVEVAFLFPWATVFGKATNLASERVALVDSAGPVRLTDDAGAMYREMGVRQPDLVAVAGTTREQLEQQLRHSARQLAGMSALAAGFFFLVLLIGFAYEWKTGALDWVRATTRQHRPGRSERAPSPAERIQEPILTG